MRRILLAAVLLLLMPSPAGAEYLGDFPLGASVYWKFSTNAASGARVDPSSAWEAADLRCYKGGSTTERSSTAGYTITSIFDTMAGITHVTIDTADNTDAGFWVAGEYQCVLYPDETVDGQLVSAAVAHFALERQTVPPVVVAGTAVTKDSTGVKLTFPIVRTSGKPFTGLVFNSPGLAIKVCRPNVNGVCVSATLTGTCTLGTFTSGCFLERDSTINQYEAHVPNTAWATGEDRGIIIVSGVAGSVPTIVPYELVTGGLPAVLTVLGTPVTSVAGDIAGVQGDTDALQAGFYRKNVAGQVKFPITMFLAGTST